MTAPHLTVHRMIELAPDLFRASQQFLLIEASLAELGKRGGK